MVRLRFFLFPYNMVCARGILNPLKGLKSFLIRIEIVVDFLIYVTYILNNVLSRITYTIILLIIYYNILLRNMVQSFNSLNIRN